MATARNIFRTEKSPPVWKSVLHLIGHLLAAGVIFVSFLAVAWLISLALYWLNGIHPFPPEIYAMITRAEVYMTYADWGICILVLAAAALRFALEIVRGDV